jgi:hypothetical protein
MGHGGFVPGWRRVTDLLGHKQFCRGIPQSAGCKSVNTKIDTVENLNESS